MGILSSMPVKWFARDIVSGKAEKVGDTFTAMFFGRETTFRVDELSHGCIMAFVVEDQ